MTTQCHYLYGVIPAGKSRDFGPIGLEGEQVRAVCEGDLAVVASRGAGVSFATLAPERTLQCLAQHQRVLERVMIDSPVIPLKFGTYADSDEHIRRILRSGQKEFAQALDRYGSRVEVDLAAQWEDIGAVLAEIATDERVVSLKNRLAGERQVSITQRVALGKLVKQLLDERRTKIAGELVMAIHGRWPNIVVNPTRDDTMLLNAAILVGRDEQAEFDQAIADLNVRYGDRLHFRCVGPLPPYSFATAEIKTIRAADLATAGKSLGLGGSASMAEIKSAHRRLLGEAHPDRNPGADTARRMREISAAYELLEEYVLNFKHTFSAAQDAPVMVKVRSLDDLRGSPYGRTAADQTSRRDRVGAEAA
jgi:hypothetical protein